MNFLANPLNRALVIAGVAVVIALFAYFTVIQPSLTQLDASQARLTSDQQTYADLKRVADQKPLYLALTRQVQSRLAGVELTADPRAYIPSYLKQIENLAKRDGLQVVSVTPQSTPVPSPAPSGAPGATPGPQSVNIGPINAASRALGSSNAQTGVTNNVAQQTENATPVPPIGGGSPAPGASAKPGTPTAGTVPTTARQNAIAYLNQSFQQVPINMELAGTYNDFQHFLRDLNKFPKLIGVGNVTMTPGAHQSVGQTPTLNIVLPIVAYRLSPSQASQSLSPSATANGGESSGG
jgi:Tfp pilus assembly protein PilO